MLPSIESRIAAELSAKPQQVVAAIALLDEGATVPFISRYRKEATGGLDDTQLRTLEERLSYLRELEDRRKQILSTIEEQEKMTPALRANIESAETKQRLEDLYLPYKPKRRTKAQIAREAGLDGLAAALLQDPSLVPETEAAKYLKAPFATEQGDNPGVADIKAALEGARAILIEQFSEDAELLTSLRSHVFDHAVAVSTVAEGKEEAAAKFRDYFSYSEPLKRIPSHRALALFRGRKEELLRIALTLPEEADQAKVPANAPLNACELKIAARFRIRDQQRPADAWLMQTARWAWQVKTIVAARNRATDRAARTRRGRSNSGLRSQSARSAARSARRTACDHGIGSRHPHGRESRHRRQDGKIARHRNRLSTCAAQRMGPDDCRLGFARAQASGRSHQHRQRNGLQRNG